MQFGVCSSVLLFAQIVSCASKPEHPPYLDPVSSGIPPVGGKPVTDSDSGVDAGSITVLASGLATPRGIALGGAQVFITVPTGILSIAKTGSAPQTFVSGIDPPNAIATSSKSACFTTDTGNVQCAPLLGGPVVTLALGETLVSSIAIDNEIAFWPSFQGGAVIERCSTSGGARSIVTTATGPFTPNGVAVGHGVVYVTTTGAGANVYQAPIQGGAAEAFATPVQASFVDAILDGTHVIVGHQANTNSELLTLSLGSFPKVLAQNLPSVGHIARDATHLYWTSPADGAVYALAQTATAVPIAIATGLASPYAIAVDDAVYVTTVDGVVRVPSPP